MDSVNPKFGQSGVYHFEYVSKVLQVDTLRYISANKLLKLFLQWFQSSLICENTRKYVLDQEPLSSGYGKRLCLKVMGSNPSTV